TNAGTSATSGAVSVVDTVPAGLTATAAGGTGWSCTTAPVSCSRSDVLNAGASYPAVALTVDVANNAPATLTNTASVSGGGDTYAGNNFASDATDVAVAPTGL